MMKNDLYYLIRTYCFKYKIGNFKEELFLHDSTPIQYTTLPMAELDRFLSLVFKYWDYFLNLISNLSCNEETVSIEQSHRVIGMLDSGKTTYNQIINNRLREKYNPLLNFVKYWVKYEYIVNKPSKLLSSAITAYLDNLDADNIYEIWIFYKIVQLFEPITKSYPPL